MPALISVHILFACWSGITTALAGLLIYRSLVAMKEEDQLFLDAAEWQLEREQRGILKRLNTLDPFIKALAIASILLLILIILSWLYHDVISFSTFPGRT